MTTEKLIETVKEKGGYKSDYALSERLGVNRNYVSQWKKNRSLPDVKNFAKLCEAAGMSMDEGYKILSEDSTRIYIMRS